MQGERSMQRAPMFSLLAGLFVGLIFLHTRQSAAQAVPFGIYTYHGDNMRTGWNAHETALTQAAVRSKRFGRLWTVKVDGKVYAQPLYAPGVDLGPAGVHNLLLVATENDSVSTFDADKDGKTPLWQASLGVPVPWAVVNCGNIYPVYGITGTPVIDPATLVLYVVAKT
jgi:hypothetical protein